MGTFDFPSLYECFMSSLNVLFSFLLVTSSVIVVSMVELFTVANDGDHLSVLAAVVFRFGDSCTKPEASGTVTTTSNCRTVRVIPVIFDALLFNNLFPTFIATYFIIVVQLVNLRS